MSLNICQTHSVQPILPLKPESRAGGEREEYLQSKSRLRDIQIKSLRRGVYSWTWLCLIHMAYSCAKALVERCRTVTEQQAALCGDTCVRVCAYVHHVEVVEL